MKSTNLNSLPIPLDPDWIKDALNHPLPGNEAHSRMSGRAPQTMQIPEGATEAAVMIAIIARPDSIQPSGLAADLRSTGLEIERYNPGLFPLILRPGNQGPHSGQISLPGGKREKGESLKDTALRETEEEIGLNSSKIHVLGKLTPLYIPVSGFAVHPYVGWFDTVPQFKRDPLEVEQILFYDMLRLSSSDYRTVFDFNYNGRSFESPGFKLEDRIIWGATAMILMEFTEHLLSRANQ
ncbi:MAG: CoA pyrophosphatase [Leptospiraceae bacterium]